MADFTQTDERGTAGFPTFSTGHDVWATKANRLVVENGQAGSTNFSVIGEGGSTAGTSKLGIWWESPPMLLGQWPIGEWTLNMNVVSATNRHTWKRTYVWRVDENNNLVATIGDRSEDVALFPTGTKSVTMTTRGSSGETNDKLLIGLLIESKATFSTTIVIKPDKDIPNPMRVPIQTSNQGTARTPGVEAGRVSFTGTKRGRVALAGALASNVASGGAQRGTISMPGVLAGGITIPR